MRTVVRTCARVIRPSTHRMTRTSWTHRHAPASRASTDRMTRTSWVSVHDRATGYERGALIAEQSRIGSLYGIVPLTITEAHDHERGVLIAEQSRIGTLYGIVPLTITRAHNLGGCYSPARRPHARVRPRAGCSIAPPPSTARRGARPPSRLTPHAGRRSAPRTPCCVARWVPVGCIPFGGPTPWRTCWGAQN